MKNYQLISIKNSYKQLKELSGSKGYYVPLVKNIKLIDIELEAFDLIKAKTKEFDEFLKRKEELLIKYSSKDDKGTPIKTIEEIDGMQYYKYDVSEDNKKLLEVEGKELMEEFNDALLEMKEREEKYLAVLEGECSVEFHKINEKDLPNEMTPELFEIIEDFVV